MRNGSTIDWKLVLWSAAIAVLYGSVMGAAVTELPQAAPPLAVPATALGLTLITAANRDRQ